MTKCVPCDLPSHLNVGGTIVFYNKNKVFKCEIVSIDNKVTILHKKKKTRISKKNIIKYSPSVSHTQDRGDSILECTAPGCRRTSKSHPINFRGIRSGVPLCQAHYIQKNKVDFTRFKPIRNSGKQQMSYDKRPLSNSHTCECGRSFNSLQSLRCHKTYVSPKTGKSKCPLIE